jgi:dolichol-phosphate mannosyltransferase
MPWRRRKSRNRFVPAPLSNDPPPAEETTPGSAQIERLLVIVPTYNERSNIEKLVEQIFRAVPPAHILVVDDESPDGTAQLVQELSAKYPRLSCLRRTGERGLGHAYTEGILYALDKDFDFIGTMDADLSHDPANLPRMLALLETCDVVIGSRYIPGGGTVNWAIGRILLSWLANKFAAILLQIPAHDITSGYRVYRRNALAWIRTADVKSTGYSFIGEVLYRAYRGGARITESPIIFHDRTFGVSKLHRREIYLGALNLLRLRFSMR